MDVVFAAADAQFLGGFVEYNSIPWDIGARRAKELCFESRFITADEAAAFGLVNRVVDPAALEAETYAYAERVAENDPLILRMVKINMNKAQDAQGFRSAVEDSLGDYVAMMNYPGYVQNVSGERRLGPVALAAKGLARRARRSGEAGRLRRYRRSAAVASRAGLNWELASQPGQARLSARSRPRA